MESWKCANLDLKSCCGFCPKVFTTWQCRVEHLAAHFKAGADMSRWTGDWGFEPHVDRLIENAMPPYMIAQERASMDPFTAQGTANKTNVQIAAMGTVPDQADALRVSDANCYRRLEFVLGKYVASALEAGIVPDDHMLQDESRRIIFHDDDPWNQTPADNAQWLAVFKRENGLAESDSTSPFVTNSAPSSNSPPTRMQDLNMHPPYIIPGGLKSKGFGQGSAPGGGPTPPRRQSGGGVVEETVFQGFEYDKLAD